MKVGFLTFMVLLVSLLLKMTVLQFIPFLTSPPDLVLITLVYISCLRGSQYGQFSGAFIGLLEDILSVSPLGLHGLIRTVTGYGVGIFKGHLVVDFILIPPVVVTAATLFRALLTSLVVWGFSISYSKPIFLSTAFLTEMLANALLAPFVFFILHFLFKALGEAK